MRRTSFLFLVLGTASCASSSGGPDVSLPRERTVAVDDQQALQGFQSLTAAEGIIPALEPSHAIYHAMKVARELGPDQDILVGLSGRGDKDMHTVAAALGGTL